MKAKITNIEIEHKYLIFTYEVYVKGFKIDTHTIQYCLESGCPAKDKIEQVLRNSLKGYEYLLETNLRDLKDKFLGLEVNKE